MWDVAADLVFVTLDAPARVVEGQPVTFGVVVRNDSSFAGSGDVSLSLRLEEATARIVVSDEGLGMAPETLARLAWQLRLAMGNVTNVDHGSGGRLAPR